MEEGNLSGQRTHGKVLIMALNCQNGQKFQIVGPGPGPGPGPGSQRETLRGALELGRPYTNLFELMREVRFRAKAAIRTYVSKVPEAKFFSRPDVSATYCPT